MMRRSEPRGGEMSRDDPRDEPRCAEMSRDCPRLRLPALCVDVGERAVPPSQPKPALLAARAARRLKPLAQYLGGQAQHLGRFAGDCGGDCGRLHSSSAGGRSTEPAASPTAPLSMRVSVCCTISSEGERLCAWTGGGASAQRVLPGGECGRSTPRRRGAPLVCCVVHPRRG